MQNSHREKKKHGWRRRLWFDQNSMWKKWGFWILLTRHVPYPMIGILIPLKKVKNLLLAISQIFVIQLLTFAHENIPVIYFIGYNAFHLFAPNVLRSYLTFECVLLRRVYWIQDDTRRMTMALWVYFAHTTKKCNEKTQVESFGDFKFTAYRRIFSTARLVGRGVHIAHR